MSSLFAFDRLQSGRNNLGWVRLSLILLGVVGALFACNTGIEPTSDGGGAGPAPPVTEEPPSNECISDPALAPAEFDPSMDLQTNISSYLMRGQDLTALESVLESMCGDLWGFEPEPLIADAMIADVNGDERDDLLLSVTLPSGGSRGEAQVYAYVLGGAGFTPYPMIEIQGAGSHGEGLYAGGGGEFLDVVDMNHEGPPEIVLAMHWDTYSEYFIANWSEPDVVSLIRYVDELGTERISILVQAGTVSIQDEDGDGMLDLVVESQEGTEIWSWDGAFFALSEPNGSTTESQPGPPAAPTWTPIANSILPLPAGRELTITSVHMVDATSGWAIGSAGQGTDHILFTNDQGVTWLDRTPPEAVLTGPVSDRRAYGYFLDGNHAWVVYSPGPLVWRTSDGGLTWSHSAQPLDNDQQIFLTDDYGAMLYFADSQHGWLMAMLDAGMSKVYMSLYRTIDGGENWELLIHPTTNPLLQTGQKTGIYFLNTQVGWVTRDTNGVIDGAFVDWTVDGGETWDSIAIPLPDIPEGVIYYCGLHSPRLFSAQSGVLGMRCPYFLEGSELERAYYLAATEDGGQTWELHQVPGGGELLFLDRQVVYALGRDIYRSEDGGATWSLVHTVAWDGQFSFVDETNIWAVAKAEDEIALVRSSNGGQSWSLIEPVVGSR